MTLISVIIPIFNAEKYLRDCLSTLESQAFQGVEYILVDDGSTDNSPRIIAEFLNRDPRFLLKTQQNYGVSHARNAGLKVARGDWVLFVDADDRLASDASLAAVVTVLAELEPPLNYVVFDVSETTRTLDLSIEGHRKDLWDSLRQGLFHAPWGKAFRRSSIESTSVDFSREIGYGEDLLFNFQFLASQNKILISSIPLYTYRRDSSTSVSRKFRVQKSNELDFVYSTIELTQSSTIPPTEIIANFAAFRLKKFNEVIGDLSTLWGIEDSKELRRQATFEKTLLPPGKGRGWNYYIGCLIRKGMPVTLLFAVFKLKRKLLGA